MPFRIMLALALGGTLIASAEPITPPSRKLALSLRDCIDLAINRNLDLKIGYPSADIARFNLNGSYGAYMPTFTFGAQHNFISQPGDFDPKKSGSDFPYDLKTDTAGPGLTGRLPLGFSYDLTAVAGERDARTDFRSVPGNSNNFAGGIRLTNNFFAEGGLTVRQHLLKDFWID